MKVMAGKSLINPEFLYGGMEPLLLMVSLVALAFAAQEACRFLRFPRVIGYIGVGVLIGLQPLRALWYNGENTQILAFLAQVGIVLLFFFSGLEISLKQFRKNFSLSSKAAFLNTLIPLALGFLAARQLGFNDMASAVIGVSLSVSAASLSVELLEEMDLLKSRLAQAILSIAALSDVLQLVAISLLLAWLGVSGTGLALYAVPLQFLAFALVFLFFRQIIAPKIIALAEAQQSHATHFSAALLITLLLAVIAEALGLGVLVGAMFGGALVRHILLSKAVHKPWEEHQLAESVHTFSFGFFVPMFYVWVGFNTGLTELAANWWLGLLFAVIASIGSLTGTILGSRGSGKSLNESLVIGWGINGKGDVELVLAALALKVGWIDAALFSTLVLMAALTMFASTFMFQRAVKQCTPELLKEGEISQEQAASY